MQNSQIVDNSQKFLEKYLNEHFDQNRTYHNFEHTQRVMKAVTQLSEDAGLQEDEVENLVLAAIFHDIGYCIDPETHEMKGAFLADDYLQSQGLNEFRRAKIKEYILATKMDWNGENLLAHYIRDADLSGLASSDYFKYAENLRSELNSIRGEQLSESEWAERNIEFFEKHSYQTNEGKKKYNKGKKKNLKKLKKIKKNELKEDKLQTIGSSKPAQTQLKTSLRNHIDLSAIADNKANIMLSINAIVITVGLPLMANQIDVNIYFLLPMIALGVSSIVSMSYATFSTRPIKMKGITDLTKIDKKKTNLFFFGNFYRMDFDTYETGIKQVVGNEEILENSITRDLFFLGKSLGSKFDYLRICYNVFMIGMLLTVVLFVLVSALVRIGGLD